MKYKTTAIKPEHMHQTGNRWTLSRIHCAFFPPLLLVSYKAAGLLWMSTENCDFVHNYMCRCCAHSVQHMPDHECVCESENVHTGVVLSAFVCIMLLPTQVLRPQRKSIANNSTATGKEPYHPRGLWDRVYNQRWSVGGWNLLGWPCVMLYIVSSFSLKNCQVLS